MSKGITAVFGAVLAAAGFGLGYYYAQASAPAPQCSIDDAPARLSEEEARRVIAEQIRRPASIESAEALGHLLARLRGEAIPAIAPTILNPSETPDAARAMLLLRYWIDRDPKGAAEWTMRNAPLGYRMLVLDSAVERIAESDPQFALKYVGGGRQANNQLLKPLIRGWIRSGQPGVEEWMRNLDYGFKRQKALGAFAREKIARDGTAAAIAWFDALPDSEDGFKEEAFRRLTIELTYADPAAGIAWYERNRDGPYGKGLLTVIADAWSGVDGPAAMRWISQQPAGPERDDAVLDGVRSWGMADVESMKRWGREVGPDRIEPWFQPGLAIFAQRIAEGDPAEGIRWAEQILDEERRHLTLLQIARAWHRNDGPAAEAWLAQSQLTEQERALAVKVSAPRGPEPKPPGPAAAR